MPAILIIEDTDTVRTMLRIMLETAGYEVAEARNGRLGIRSFHQSPPDLVITDIYMPECDGLEVIQELRRFSSTVRIVAMTGYCGEMDLLEAARKFGAMAVLHKPFTMQSLLRTVSHSLKERTGNSVRAGSVNTK
jgi:DNA-binding response OmpR family regulator